MKTKKNTIRLTESELKRVIAESVKRILKEDFEGKEYGFSQDSIGTTPDWKRRDYERMEQEVPLSQRMYQKPSKPSSKTTKNVYQETPKTNTNLLIKISDDEIIDMAYDFFYDIQDNPTIMPNTWSPKIVEKNEDMDENYEPCLVCSVVIYDYGKPINYESQYSYYSIVTLDENSRYFSEEFANSSRRAQQYLITLQITNRDIQRKRKEAQGRYQAEWDEEDRMYGHDNFDEY